MSDNIEAKVAAVPSRDKIVLNKGIREQIKVDQEVILFRYTDVVDPDTSEPLGTVRTEKGRMKIVSVQEKLCVAQTRSSAGFFGSSFSQALGFSDLPRVRKVKSSALIPDVSQDDIEVEIGEVVLIIVK